MKESRAFLKDHTALHDGINMEDKPKIPIGNKKCIFWQTSINDQRPKLRVCINNMVIKGLLNMGLNVTIFTSESWHSNWPLQDADVQFLGIRTLSQVKQSMR